MGSDGFDRQVVSDGIPLPRPEKLTRRAQVVVPPFAAKPLSRNDRALLGVQINARDKEATTLQEEVVRESPVYLTSFFVHLVLIILLALIVWKQEDPAGVLLVATNPSEVAAAPLEVDFSLLPTESQTPNEQAELVPEPASAPLSATTSLPTSLTPVRYMSADSLGLRDGYAGVSGAGVDMKPSAAKALRDQEGYKSKARFFNVGAEGNRFVFVIDASGSMMEGNRWQMAVRELLKSVEALEEEQEFFVFLYSSGTSLMFDMGAQDAKMFAATPDNYNKLYQWLETRFPLGSTLPKPAMKMAIDLNPDAIFLLSDGEIQDDTYEFLLRYNKPREMPDRSPAKIPIHTIALDFSLGGFYLRNIADTNNGKFTQKFSE